MDTLIIVALWIWGAYKGWGIVADWGEWLNRKEPASYIVKGAICVVLGAIFGLWALVKICWKIVRMIL